MQLTTAMLADGAQQAGPGAKLYILGGQWDRLTVANFPAQHPTLAVVLVLRVEYSEALDQHRLEVELMLDGRSMKAKALANFTTGHAPGQTRGTPGFVPVALTFNNLVFEAAGRYEWAIRVDGDPIGTVPIEVVQQMNPGMFMPPAVTPPSKPPESS